MSENTPLTGLVTTIGYGDRSWNDFLNRLGRFSIDFVIDVRSRPFSRQPEFNRDNLKLLLSHHSLKYVFMGDQLGGRPDDPNCYTNGKVDYDQCEKRHDFIVGLKRLVAAIEGGHRLALLCSEIDPERCHRSKLIGEALARRGVQITHIDRDGNEVSQEAVITKLTQGQLSLFSNHFTSRCRYIPQQEKTG